MGIVERRQDAPVALGARSLEQCVLQARLDLAGGLVAAIAAERLGPQAYMRWIACEHALASAGAATLAGIGVRASGAFRGRVLALSAALHAQAAMAAADVRRTGGMANTTGIVALDHWRDDYDLHAHAHPWRVLGAVALHASAMGGSAASAVSAVLGLPFLSVRGATYLLHRQLQAGARADDLARLWHLLPDDPAAHRDLLEGATRAAALYRQIARDLLVPAAAPSAAGRWRFDAPGMAVAGGAA